ncbi:hypothetical protein KBB96_04480 [Luteolibacter ambystomatis]|uniref:Uncharacterized protein n=1 Tax=Luteolibacter ambystomatis TaxID=2824561 RepID=A0A975PGC9_9BACT|nr:hypothetical protein [Luteolibacter ambystomatis]QUE52151.1 hypothetical protein KBB96_04480 [Luteolibacter ambystomatis]
MERRRVFRRAYVTTAILAVMTIAWLGRHALPALGKTQTSSPPAIARPHRGTPVQSTHKSPLLAGSDHDVSETPDPFEEFPGSISPSAVSETTVLARTDPATAAGQAIDALEDPDALQQALVAVIALGRIDDRDTLRTWIDEVPPGPLRDTLEAEWKRGHDLTPPPPAFQPGENHEDRAPLSRR